jgi:hypothetical protein
LVWLIGTAHHLASLRLEQQTTPITNRSPGNAENADIAASAGSGKRQTPNAFLSPPTSGTLFDVLSRKRRERRHRRERRERKTPNAERFPISTDQRDAI